MRVKAPAELAAWVLAQALAIVAAKP